ncbi:acyltransferase family protein [Xylophilus sp. GOD-11R]|uniref:acyltransferase family protein n=1 Tax=Xylophilus sp. GOD-11R TaxID=3089814 RepID=UPI00298CAD9D|nr:acyltransferase family protein [Xylophilus sp. GOD-11R]WPB57440.1 acyltransferase family protein [Xylophilus sp. GOD-11R]
MDIAKGLAMLLVLYGHGLGVFVGGANREFVFEQLKIIYAFHMPVFFMLSGMVFTARRWAETLRRALSLLLTAYIVHLLCWVYGAAMHEGPVNWAGLIRPLLELRQFWSVIVWFLAALALVQTVYFAAITAGRWGRIVIIGLVVAAFVWAQGRRSNVFELSALLPGLVFYGLGHALAHAGVLWRVGRRHGAVIAGLALATVWLAGLNGGCAGDAAGTCDNLPGAFIVLMIAGQYGFLPLFLAAALAGSALVLGLARLIELHHAWSAAALAWVGRRSLQLLVINGLLIFFLHPVLEPAWQDAGRWWTEVGALGLVAGQLLVAWLFAGITSAPLRLAKFLVARVPALR